MSSALFLFAFLSLFGFAVRRFRLRLFFGFISCAPFAGLLRGSSVGGVALMARVFFVCLVSLGAPAQSW